MCDTMDKNRKKIMEELMQKLEEKNRKREENGGGRDEASARNVLEQGIRENEVRGDDESKDKVQVDDDVLYIDKELLSDRKSKTKKRSEGLKNAIKCIQCQFEVNGSEVNFVFYCPQCNEYWLILNEMMGIEGNESSINLSRLGDNVEDESKVEVLQKILADLLPSVSSEDSKDEEKYRTEIEATEKEESKASFDREQLNLAISDVIEALQSRKQDSSRSRISKSGALRQTGFFSIGIQEGAANVPEPKNKPKVGAKSETASKESVNKSGKALKRKADEMNEKPSDLTDETTQQVQGKERTSGKEEEPGAVDKKESKIFYTPISVSDTYLILQNESTTKSSETGKAIDGKDSRVESLERSNTKKEIEKSVDQESIAGKSSKGTSVGEKSAKSLIKEKLPQESPKEETDRSIKSVDMQSAMGNTISELNDNLKVMMPSEFVQLEEGEISDRDHMRPEHKTSSTQAVDGKSEKSSVSSVEKGSKPGEKTFYTDMLSTISQLWSKKSVNKKSPRDRSELSSSQARKMNKTPAEAGKEKPTGTSMESRSSMDKLESSGRDKEKISSKISSVTPSISIREVKQSSMVKSTTPKNEETSEEQTKPRTETEKGSKNGKSTVSFAGEKMVESKPIDRSNVDRTEGTGYAADVENELSMPVKDGVSEERKTESSDKSVSARSTGKNTVERSITVSSRENAQKPSQKVVGKGNSHNLVDDMRKLVEEEESLKVKKKSPNNTIKSDSSFTTQTRTTTDRSSEKSSKIYQMSDAELKEAIGDTEKLQSLEKKLNATNSTLNRHVSSIQDAVGAHDDFITAQEVVLGDETLKQMENKSREEEEQSKAEKKVQKTVEGSGVTGSSKPTLGKSMIDSLQVRKRSRSELDKEDEKAAETVPTETITVRTPTEEVFNDSDIIDNVPTEKKSFIDVLKSKIDSNRSVRDIGDHTESEQSIGVSYFEDDKRKSSLGKSNEISERMFGSKVSADAKTIENIGDYNDAEQQVAEESREGMKSDGKTIENIGDYNDTEQQVAEESREGMKSDGKTIENIGDYNDAEQQVAEESREGMKSDGKTIENIGDYNDTEQQVAEESREGMKSDGKTIENIGDYNDTEQQVAEESREGMKSDGKTIENIGDYNDAEQQVAEESREGMKSDGKTIENIGDYNDTEQQVAEESREGMKSDGKTIENIGDYNDAEQQVAEESREGMKSDGKTIENIGDYNDTEQQVAEKSREGMKSDENMARDERKNMERSAGPVSESSSPAGKTTTSSEIRTKSRNMSTITNYGSGVKSESSTSRLKDSVIKEVKNLSSIKESSSRSTSPTLSSTPVKSAKKEKGRISEIRKTLTSGQKEDKKALLSKSISSKASSSVEQKSPVPEKSKPSKASIPSAEDKSTVREPLSSGDIVFPKTPTTSNIKERKSTSVNVSTADSSTIYSNSNPLVVVDTDKKEPKEEESSEKLPMQQKSDEKGAQPKLEKMTDGSVAKDKSLRSVGSKGVPVELMYEDVSAARESKIKGVDGVTKKETGDEKLKGKKIEGEEKKKKLVDDKRKEGEPAEDKSMADKVPSDRRTGEKQPKDKEQIDLSKIQKGRGTKSDMIASSSSSTRKESVENQHKAFISDKEGMEQSTSKVPVSQLKESINHSVSSSTHDKSVSKVEQSEQKTDEKQQLTHHVSFSDYSSYEVETVEEEPAAGRRDTEEEKVKKKKARRSKGEESTEIGKESRAASVIIPRYKLKPTRKRKDKHKVKVYLLHSRMTSSDSLSDKSDKVDVGDGRVQQLVKFFEKIIKKTDEKKE